MNKKQNVLSSFSSSDIKDPNKAQEIAELVVKHMEENKGATLRQALGLSDEALEKIYSLAHSHYNSGKYQDASSLFYMLISISPTSFKYALGLAASYHALNLYQDAINGFFLAHYLDSTNPIPTFYIADSFIKMQEHPELAEAFLETTIDLCNGNTKHQELKDRSILMKQFLKK
ncbi:MAG: SycD/LcrH family type III secretion system chaperone [Chlamydiales bacterium]